MTKAAIAVRFGVSTATAVRIGQRARSGKGLMPAKIGGYVKPILRGDAADAVRQRLVAKSDWTVRALSADLKAAGISVSHDTIWRFLRSEGKTFKKNTGGMRIGQAEGCPVLPHGHWKTLTFLAGLRRNSIVAPFILDGPINSLAFTAWVEQSLVPTLKPRDIVILDNLGSHKGKPVRDAIRDVGAHLFFLPPYSPDLNPIEMMYAKLKALVRKAEERTVETTWRRIGKFLTAFSPQECANYLRHAGYGSK